jgi:acyl-CoA thioesterase FadM
MDAMGHVNNTIYFRYMETVRLEWLFQHISGAEWRRLGIVYSGGMNRSYLNDAIEAAQVKTTPANKEE